MTNEYEHVTDAELERALVNARAAYASQPSEANVARCERLCAEIARRLIESMD